MHADPPRTPPVPVRFVLVTFAVAIAVGVLIAYYGLHGQIGASIP